MTIDSRLIYLHLTQKVPCLITSLLLEGFMMRRLQCHQKNIFTLST